MFKFLLRSSLTTLGLALLAATSTLEAQLRDVVSKEVAVGRSEAALRLEFSDDGALEIAFEDGLVVIDGDVVGMFEPGDQLEAAWRSLLGQAVSLDDGELAIMLSDWSVPADLANDLADLALLLLDQACIIEGETLPDTAAFSRRMAMVMAKAAG